MEPGQSFPMDHTRDSASLPLDRASSECLARTRSAVLNVLVAIGLMIAVSGWILRPRAAGVLVQDPRKAIATHHALHAGLIILAVASFLSRRIMARRATLSDPRRRASRFYWSHAAP